MSGFINALVRGACLLWTLLLTALVGNLIAVGNNNASIGYTMFVAVLSWIVTIIGLLSTVVYALSNPKIIVSLDSALLLFSLVAGIVLAAQLNTVDCHSSQSTLRHQHVLFDDSEGHCRQAQASAVFVWFVAICSGISLFFSIVSSRNPLRGSIV